MPTIRRLTNCKIAMYADDHAPPHFHVVGPDWRCSIDLSTMEMIAGEAPRRDLKEALDWGRQNRRLLLDKWSELNERD